jgi:uncharacterized protein (DUF4415 family)
MSEKRQNSSSNWVDPDDAPELSDADFTRGTWCVQGKAVGIAEVRAALNARGRPKAEMPKQQVTLRLDRDILDRFRAAGPGWQTRINEALRKTL